MADTPTNQIIFQWFGETIFTIHWDTGKSELLGTLDQAAGSFWTALEFNYSEFDTVSFIHPKTKQERLVVDMKHRRIWNGWWNPETSFLLSEIEKRGNDNWKRF